MSPISSSEISSPSRLKSSLFIAAFVLLSERDGMPPLSAAMRSCAFTVPLLPSLVSLISRAPCFGAECAVVDGCSVASAMPRLCLDFSCAARASLSHLWLNSFAADGRWSGAFLKIQSSQSTQLDETVSGMGGWSSWTMW